MSVFLSKIVGLRESERKLQVQIEEQEMKSIQQKNIMRELESALEHIKSQCDRQLTHQRREHEKKVQFILNHFKGIIVGWGLYTKYFLWSLTEKYCIPTDKNE